MTPRKWPVLAVFLLCAAGQQARAGPDSANRYIDLQGVEMIQDRASAIRTGKPVKVAADQTDKAQPAMQITPASQARMDLDRIAILEQELKQEVLDYETALKRTQSQETNPGTIRLSRESLNEHRHNIIALNAELRRSKPAH